MYFQHVGLFFRLDNGLVEVGIDGIVGVDIQFDGRKILNVWILFALDVSEELANLVPALFVSSMTGEDVIVVQGTVAVGFEGEVLSFPFVFEAFHGLIGVINNGVDSIWAFVVE